MKNWYNVFLDKTIDILNQIYKKNSYKYKIWEVLFIKKFYNNNIVKKGQSGIAIPQKGGCNEKKY